MRKLLRRLHYWLNHRRAAAELAEEIESHRLMRQSELERSGLPAAEARTASRRALGNTVLAAEAARDVWISTWLDDAWRDLRSALRDVRKAPVFWVGASLILSLGIGVNIAAFQMLDVVFWRPPGVRNPESLVRLFGPHSGGFPYPAAQLFETNGSALSSVLIRSDSSVSTFNDIHEFMWVDDFGNRPKVSFVSANWFDDLDHRPIRGRVFHAGVDDAASADPGVVISEVFWEKRLNRDPEIVGKRVRVNNRPAVVLGVVSPDIMPHNDMMVWMPIAKIDYFVPGTPFKTSWDLHGVQIYGRLRPGVSESAARQALQPVMDELIRRQPKVFEDGDSVQLAPATERFVAPGRNLERWMISTTGLGLTILILIIACANLINLVLSRAVSRVRDLSIRVSLGAGQWRIMRQLIAEGALLVALSSVGGLLLVYCATRIFLAMDTGFAGLPDFTMNWRVTFATLLTASVAVAAIGLFPAWRISRSDLMTAIKDGGQQASAAIGRTRWKHVFLGAQIGCSCILLVLTGLILHSLQRMVSGMGFDHENVAVLTVPLERRGVGADEALAYWRRLRETLEDHPEAASVSLVSRVPFGRGDIEFDSALAGRVRYYEVGPGFFDVMRIPILAGRGFDAADVFGTSAIISRRLAMKMYGTLNVIGQGFPKDAPRGRVIGVVEDAFALGESAEGNALYVPLNPKESVRVLIVRARASAATLVPVLSAAARAQNDDIMPDAHLLSRDFAYRGGDARAMSRLLGVLGLLALSITCVGIFGTTSYAASLRRQEIGIRMALGGDRGSIVLLLLGQLRWPVCAGLVFGLGVAIPVGGLFAGVPLFVKPFDPLVMAIVALFLVITAVLAALLPAWRALGSNPLQSLRSE